MGTHQEGSRPSQGSGMEGAAANLMNWLLIAALVEGAASCPATGFLAQPGRLLEFLVKRAVPGDGGRRVHRPCRGRPLGGVSWLHIWGPREATFRGSRGCPLPAAGPGCFRVGGLGCRRENRPGKVKRLHPESLGWAVVRAGIVTQADLAPVSVPRGAALSVPTPRGFPSRPALSGAACPAPSP